MSKTDQAPKKEAKPTAKNLKQSLQDLTIEQLAFTNFSAYVALQHPNYDFGKHHLAIIQALEALERGDIRRLIINTAPRHGKSLLASEYFPAWYMGRNPDHQIIASAYSFDRASDTGRKVKNQLLEPLHHKIFPGCTVATDSKSSNKVSTKQGGNMYSLGIGSGTIGRGAHCVCGNTIVATMEGTIKISELAEKIEKEKSSSKKEYVLSWDEDKKRETFNEVLAVSKSFRGDIYEITTNSGNRLRVTGDHRVYVPGQGYRCAKDLVAGTPVLCARRWQVSDMWSKYLAPDSALLPRMLFEDDGREGGCCLYFLRKNINETCLRNKESNKKGSQGLVLFTGVLDGTPRNQEQAEVCPLWKTCRKKNKKVLRGLQECWPKNKSNRPEQMVASLSQLSFDIQSSKPQVGVLLKELCESRSFQKDDRIWQFEIQRRPKLCRTISRNEKSCSATRPSEVRFMLEKESPNIFCQGRYFPDAVVSPHSPHRQGCDKQQTGKLDLPLSEVSSRFPYGYVDTISTVKKIGCEKIPVYDIQVEGTSNFFADGILVHNCLIVDDPIASRADAESEIMRNRLVEWYRGVAYTRLMPDNRICIIQTRWHAYDLTGFLLDENKHENWTVLSLPAIAEGPDFLGRKDGEALWPSHYPKSRLLEIKNTIGLREWSSQYQQKPMVEEGALVRMDQFKTYPKYEWRKYEFELKHGARVAPPFGIKQFVCSWDTAFKESQINDPSACTVWGISPAGYYLLYVHNQRMSFPTLVQSVIKIYEMNKKYGMGPVPVLIEDKASGQSLIQELGKHSRIPIIAVKPEGNKINRLTEVSVLFESGKVYIPDRAAWLDSYLSQMTQFPYGRHDDMVDSTSQFLRWADKPKYKPSGVKYWK